MPTAPNVGATDAPTVLIEINEQWRSHVLGMLEDGTHLNYWSGTEAEKLDAASEFQAVLEAVMAGTRKERIGEVKMWSGRDIPDNWLMCDGQTYNRADYPELYDMLHPTLQVSSEAFKTPDMVYRFPQGAVRLTGDNWSYEDMLGTTGGEAEHTLTVNEMPAHTHAPATPGESFVTTSTSLNTGRVLATATGANYQRVFGGETTANRGGGQPHNNLPPYFTLYFCIVAR